jgi:hypothetical protein
MCGRWSTEGYMHDRKEGLKQELALADWNVKESTIEEPWNGERAARFREYRRNRPLAVCYCCEAKYMSEIEG